MANRREGTTLPDWPCDALGRLCIGDKMVHRLTGLWGGTDPDPGVMVDLLVLCGGLLIDFWWRRKGPVKDYYKLIPTFFASVEIH